MTPLATQNRFTTLLLPGLVLFTLLVIGIAMLVNSREVFLMNFGILLAVIICVAYWFIHTERNAYNIHYTEEEIMLVRRNKIIKIKLNTCSVPVRTGAKLGVFGHNFISYEMFIASNPYLIDRLVFYSTYEEVAAFTEHLNKEGE